MSDQPAKTARHYARLICQHLKALPDQYAADPDDVRHALGLSAAEFDLGLRWCVERSIIELEAPKAPPARMPAPAPADSADDLMDIVDEPSAAAV